MCHFTPQAAEQGLTDKDGLPQRFKDFVALVKL